MKELTMKDLTPEIMNRLKDLKTAQEIKEYCQKEGYVLTDELAERIALQFETSGELSDDDASSVTGGIWMDVGAGWIEVDDTIPVRKTSPILPDKRIDIIED